MEEFEEIKRYEEQLPRWKRIANFFRALLGWPLYSPDTVIVFADKSCHSPLLLPAPQGVENEATA